MQYNSVTTCTYAQPVVIIHVYIQQWLYGIISGATEVYIATMSKSDRCKIEVYVCGFVPSNLLPNKRPNSPDPFLQPLMEDMEELFINGIWSDAIYSIKLYIINDIVLIIKLGNAYLIQDV